MFFMNGIEIFVPIMFCLVFGVMIFTLIKNISQWHKNNQSPRLTVDATVVAKRQNTTQSHQNDHVSYSTTYYVTFEVESGDRMELHVNGSEYGMLVEGDYGKLTFQGTRYLGFVRM